jgi:sortase (surface protein transpeptidase)
MYREPHRPAQSELTLITCYGFYFVGAAPKRFVVHARPDDISGGAAIKR